VSTQKKRPNGALKIHLFPKELHKSFRDECARCCKLKPVYKVQLNEKVRPILQF
jgi:hypothetical protein